MIGMKEGRGYIFILKRQIGIIAIGLTVWP